MLRKIVQKAESLNRGNYNKIVPYSLASKLPTIIGSARLVAKNVAEPICKRT